MVNGALMSAACGHCRVYLPTADRRTLRVVIRNMKGLLCSGFLLLEALLQLARQSWGGHGLGLPGGRQPWAVKAAENHNVTVGDWESATRRPFVRHKLSSAKNPVRTATSTDPLTVIASIYT